MKNDKVSEFILDKAEAEIIQTVRKKCLESLSLLRALDAERVAYIDSLHGPSEGLSSLLMNLHRVSDEILYQSNHPGLRRRWETSGR